MERHWQFFKQAETECKETLEAKIPYAAYEWLMNCSHWFNVLDARGAISVTQRTAFIGMIRSMALSCAKCYRVVKGIDKEEK